MQESTGPEKDSAGSAPDQNAAASLPLNKEAQEFLNQFVQDKVNEVVHAAFTKRNQPIEKKLSDITAQLEGLTNPTPAPDKGPSEMDLLKRQMSDLTGRLEGAKKELQDKEVASHITSALTKHNVQMPEVAAMVLSKSFSFKDGRVVGVDQYGQETTTEKLIEALLHDKPPFRPARNAQGTATSGGGGSRPGLPEQSEPTTDGSLNKEELVKAAGSEDKAKALGWI